MSVIGRNIVWLLISQLATWAATLVTLIIVPDRLGSSDFGMYGYAVSYVEFFQLVAGLGTNTLLTRLISRDHGTFGPYVWNALWLKVVLVAGLSAVALGLAVALGNRGTQLLLIGIGCGTMFFLVQANVFSGALLGVQRAARPAMWTVVQVYFQTIAGVVVLQAGWGVVAYATVMMLGQVIPVVGMGMVTRPYLRGHRKLDWAVWRALVVGGIPLMTLMFFSMVYGTINVPILLHLSGREAVGWYVLALRWVAIPIFITTAVVSAYFPAFSQHGNPMTPHFAPLVNRSVALVVLITVPAATGLALVADDLIHFIYSSGQYDSSIIIMRILALQIPITAITTMLGTALVAADRVGRYIYVSATVAAINPVACFFVIRFADERWDNGAIGSAIVMVATEVLVLIGALAFRSKGVMDRAALGHVARVLAAAGVMTGAVLLVRDQNLMLQVLAGVVSYGVASLAFRAITRQDVQRVVELRAMLRRRAAGGHDEGAVQDGSRIDPDGPTRVGGDLHPQP
ncbi:MAG TPA: flippase [Ilumatobacter sp.]|nr:flippase [Ilumatobacter sp.]